MFTFCLGENSITEPLNHNSCSIMATPLSSIEAIASSFSVAMHNDSTTFFSTPPTAVSQSLSPNTLSRSVITSSYGSNAILSWPSSSCFEAPSSSTMLTSVVTTPISSTEIITPLSINTTSSSISVSSSPTPTSPLEKYLKFPTPSRKEATTRRASKMRAITGARVLTSDDCWKIIQEKENQKKVEFEKKERRKKEREEKRRQKVEEMKRKQEKKEEEKRKREEAKKRKEEENVRKKQKKVMKEKEKRKRDTESQVVITGSKRKRSNNLSEQSSSGISEEESSEGRSLRRRVSVSTIDDTMNETCSKNCCVCDRSMDDDIEEGEDAEWTQCSCKRWIHEDCIIETDKYSKQLCPYCVFH